MPVYVYECGKCKHVLEEIQKLKDPAPEECPACGAKQTLERLMGLSSFQLTGTGWAKDGYS